MDSFNPMADPWLDVLLNDGRVVTRSLREVLTQAHEVAQISEASPLAEVALLRMLIALVSDGLRTELPNEEAWAAVRERYWDGFTPEAVDAILATIPKPHDVLHPEHTAFFDGPAVRQVRGWDDPKALQPASRFLPEVPTGTNIAHFFHISDDVSAVCIVCLLKSRAVEAAFARGGLGPSVSRNLLATIGGSEPRYVIPRGQTLLETLLLNLVVGDASRPSWVAVHSAMQGAPGPLARLSWRPRLMMVAPESQIDQACIRCGSVERPRFAQAVMVDTYNHAGSRYGTKSNLEAWKAAPGDPHLLPSEKNALVLGLREEEWPLRALVRGLSGTAGNGLNQLAGRTADIGRVQITVTSTSGNQAKVDDAIHTGLAVPGDLLARSADERQAMAEALAAIFDKKHQLARIELIPAAVPDLLAELAASHNPQEAVQAWLARGKPPAASKRLTECSAADDETIALYEVARRAIRLLETLPESKRALLRPPGRGGTLNAAARQEAFTTVWHRLVTVPGSKRHAVREAIATVAPIYAVHAGYHHATGDPTAFTKQLEKAIRRERAAFHSEGTPALQQRLYDVVHAPQRRDELLLRLVDQLVVIGKATGGTRCDFAALLVDVAHWNVPEQPTPERWRSLLEPARAGT